MCGRKIFNPDFGVCARILAIQISLLKQTLHSSMSAMKKNVMGYRNESNDGIKTHRPIFI